MIRLSVVTAIVLVTGTLAAQHRWHVSLAGGSISPAFLISGSPGYQLEGAALFTLPDSMQLTFCSGYHRWDEELGPGGTSFRSTPALVGVRIPLLHGPITPYMSGEAGIAFMTRRYTFEVYEQTSSGVYRRVSAGPAKESVTKFAFRFAVGSTIGLSERVRLDLSGRYARIGYAFVYDHATQVGTGALNSYGLLLGVVVDV